MTSPSENVTPASRILVAGATGYIGRALVRELLERGYRVVALVRPGVAAQAVDALNGAECRSCEPCDSASLERCLGQDTFDAIFSCLASRNGAPADARKVDFGANLNLLEAARQRGVGHFILLSAICVQRPRLAFQFAKLDFEQRLVASGLRYTIVRPTAYFKSLAGQIERVKRGKPFLVFGNGQLTACKPVSAADLAAFMADCLTESSRFDAVLPIGGPGPALTPLAQADILFALLGKDPRLRRVPLWLMDGIIAVLAVLSGLMPRLRDRVEFARTGRYYASESMLVWDAAACEYSAAATPETGSETLEDFYRRVLERGMAGHELGDHALFDRGPGHDRQV